MSTNHELLSNHIENLERILQSPEARCSEEEFDRLLSDDFMEIGRSGLIYSKEDILPSIAEEGDTKYYMWDFNLNQISDGIVQATYKTRMIKDDVGYYALRSSLWRLEDRTWQMFFHQGTPMHNNLIPHEL